MSVFGLAALVGSRSSWPATMFRALDVVANSLGVGKSRGAGAGARNDANPVKSRFKGRLWVELKAAGARLVQGVIDGEGIEATT